MYTILDKNYFVLYAQKEQPKDGYFTELLVTDNFIKPKLLNEVFIEGATKEEIEEYNKTKQEESKLNKYNELLKTDWYFTRLIEKGIEVPKEIIEQRELIRNR